MANRAASVRQADVKRALKAAKDAGLQVTGCKIMPGGQIDLQFAGERPAMKPLDNWMEGRRDAR